MTKNVIALVMVGLFMFAGCRKNDDAVTPELDSNFRQHNSDLDFQKSESDQADSDIDDALKDIPGFGKSAGAQSTSPLCGVTIDSSQIAQKILFFNFDGITPCFSPSRTRSGQIKVQLTSGQAWSNAGAVLTLTFINFQVTRLYDGKWVKFNGVKTLTNVNGHNWLGFLAGTFTNQYRERALNISVAFNNGATAVWNSARLKTWTYTSSLSRINFECTGDTVVNGTAYVDSWGVNRFGDAFTTYYSNSWKSNSYCGFWRPVSGTIFHDVASSQFEINLGVDQSGVPSQLNCAYGYKVTWYNNGNSYSQVFSY